MLIVASEQDITPTMRGAFLEQVGVDLPWLNLAKADVKGNGHLMFVGKNNFEFANDVTKWLLQQEDEK